MSEIGMFYPAMFYPAVKAKGYLISCELPPPQVFVALRETPTDACEYSRALGLERYKSMPDCESFAAQFAFQKIFRWASHDGVRTAPFETDERGFFNVSAVAGNYLVVVTGRAGSHPWLWVLSGVQLKKTVTITLLPTRVV
jgi:hypothetical protein